MYINLSNELKYLKIPQKELARCFGKEKSKEKWISMSYAKILSLKMMKWTLYLNIYKQKGAIKQKKSCFIFG